MRGASGALAHRYARALLEVVVETKADGQALRTDLDGAARIFLDHPELLRVLQNPAVGVDVKKKVLSAVWATVAPLKLTERLVDLLVARDRLPLLRGIAEAYAEIWNERRGFVAAEAVTALALSDAQKGALVEALRKGSGLAIDLLERVEPEVLGGLLVQMGGKTYDGTVRGRLGALRALLQS
ncbi:MAG: ATP synthase F1 subunit delta [Solirubrobacterales bacterium]